MNHFLSQRGQSFGLGGNTTPSRLIKLYDLCCQLSEAQDSGINSPDDIWTEIREWLLGHSRADVQEAVMHQGTTRKETALHLVCEHKVPYVIIERMLAAAPIAAQLIDVNGRLPLHYASANGADDSVLGLLVEVYPVATQMADTKGVVPLHFALSTKGREISPVCARVLSQGHANSCKDEVGGMLPIHYACAYGAPVEVLEILVNLYDKDLHEAKDKRGMVPLHYICGNPYRPASPEALAFMISVSPRSVDVVDRNSSLPLRLLAIKTASSTHETEPYHENAQKILELYLGADPIYNSDFLTALQALPEWLRDRAVTTKSVQIKLNQIIATRLPSALMIGDFFGYIAIIISFYLGVTCTIQNRMPTEATCDSSTYSTFLLVPTFYFLLREIVQFLSTLSLGLIRTYFSSGTNYIDVLILFIGFYFFFDINSLDGFGGIDCKGDRTCIINQLNTFRTLASVALLVVWAALLTFLKSTYLEFAVFIGGLSNVFSKFLPFLVSLFIILYAFADIFVMIYFDSERCKCGYSEPPDYCEEEYPDFESDYDYFCSQGKTLLKVYTMLLGEVSDEEFLVRDTEKEGYVQNLGIVFFIFFMFLVVILLANVLIAIVTDSYGVIKNERASVVFWTNRLDYIAECDAIINGPWKNRLREIFYTKGNGETKEDDKIDGMKLNSRENFGGGLWDKCMNPSNSFSDYKFYTVEFWTIFIIRFLSFILILIWLPLGLVTLGLLWPPQVREGIFYSTVNQSVGGQMKLLEQRSVEVRSLRDEVKDLQDEILKEMSTDREEVVAMKTQFREMKESLQKEMKSIKQIVTLLFDLQSLDEE